MVYSEAHVITYYEEAFADASTDGRRPNDSVSGGDVTVVVAVVAGKQAVT